MKSINAVGQACIICGALVCMLMPRCGDCETSEEPKKILQSDEITEEEDEIIKNIELLENLDLFMEEDLEMIRNLDIFIANS